MPKPPDVWLRGPIADIPASLQPIAHALMQTIEDVEGVVEDLTHEQLWRRIGTTASIGFHVRHIAGSTDRLFSYSRTEELNARQRELLEIEASLDAEETAEVLVRRLKRIVEAALAHLRAVDPDSLDLPIGIGRAGLPSTPRGALSHAAEHAQRHAGQAITTALLIRAGVGT